GAGRGQASAASSRCISAALPPFHSSRLIVPASHQRWSAGDDSKAWPSSPAALRKAIHLKLLPSSPQPRPRTWPSPTIPVFNSRTGQGRSEEHTSELQSQSNLVCRLLLEKKKKKK